MQTTQHPNMVSSPSTPAPHGTETGDWQHDGGVAFRLLYGTSRTIPDRPDVVVQATAVQLGDGSIDQGAVEQPGVHVAVGGHPLTVEQARRLAVEVLGAADHLAAVCGSNSGSGSTALRYVLASTDPARLTPAVREAMYDVIQKSERLELEAMEARRAARGLS